LFFEAVEVWFENPRHYEVLRDLGESTWKQRDSKEYESDLAEHDEVIGYDLSTPNTDDEKMIDDGPTPPDTSASEISTDENLVMESPGRMLRSAKKAQQKGDEPTCSYHSSSALNILTTLTVLCSPSLQIS
jgi:hypothetical protein